MSRESCIKHSDKQALAIVRQDYYELTDHDACAAALLNIFEYWANAAIAVDPTAERPWVGPRPIREFEQRLLGIATDKQIRKRLSLLEKRGFIRTQTPTNRGAAKVYQVLIPEIQQALFGQITELETTPRSYNPNSFGQITDEPSVKQPRPLRSNDQALKNISKEFKKEDLKNASLPSMNFEQNKADPAQTKHQARHQANQQQEPAQSPVNIGTVQYAQPPDTIDLSALLATNPGIAKAKLHVIAPGHKRLEMVAHGFGQWWIGPGLNDFDEFLIKACQQRKRKLEQPHEIGDAKTFINNLIRRDDWANFSLRCDEAKVLCAQALTAQATKDKQNDQNASTRPFSIHGTAHTQQKRAQLEQGHLERIQSEQRHAAIGLAKFKISKGEVTRAKEIADQLGIAYSAIGLIAHRKEAIAA